ncbi:MAG TPA: hypothetical protein VK446_13235 [Methylocystis sp.]|nr:hypothetical protein [Methylocystis sp.]
MAFAALAALNILPVSAAFAEGPDTQLQAPCAGLGGDFVAVAGARGCVRIGHVRSESTHARSRAADYPVGFSAAGDGLRPASETYKIRSAPTAVLDFLPH